MKILFIHNAPTTFVRIDRDLLGEDYQVEELYLKSKKSLRPFHIWQAVQRNELVFGWFASWHTYLPILFAKIQGKPSILVAGGYDTANVPEAQYGNQRKWFSRIITNATIRMAGRIICNSEYTKQETMAVSGIPANRISTVYHGIPNSVASQTKISKENILLNVGNVSQENLFRKGIQPFLDAAQLLPEFKFIQVGKWKDESASNLQERIPTNAELKGFVSDEELQDLYAKSKYYVQPSLHEGFGMSVVEAMQHGCIPLISREGALPEVVGKYGVCLESTTSDAIAEAIKKNESLPNGPSAKQISAYVLDRYTLEMRKAGLVHCIQSIR